MTLVVIAANSTNQVPNAVFIPTAAINRFSSFEPATEYSEGYIFETLLAYISVRINWYTQSNRILGVHINRNKIPAQSDNISVTTLITATHWIAFIYGTVMMVPYPTKGSNANLGSLPLTQLFPGAKTVKYGDTVTAQGVLIDYDELRHFGLSEHSFTALSDARQMLVSLLFLIETKGKKTADTRMSSVTSVQRFNHGIAQVIDVLFSSINQKVKLTEREFENSSFLKTGVMWTQNFTGSESDPQSIRIAGQ